MQLTHEPFERIAYLLPRQRGNVRLDTLAVLNAILSVAANGCTWRALPSHDGSWHSVDTRLSRWVKAGVFEPLQRQRLMRVCIEAVSLDSTIVTVHPHGTGALKKTTPNPSVAAAVAGVPSVMWLPRVPATWSSGV